MGVVRIIGEQVQPGWLRLTVSDDGRGIPEGDLARVFEPFFTTKFGRGGSGLGLHLAHHTATQVLDGMLAAYSVPGEGASFVLDLPCEAPSASSPAGETG